MSPSHPQETVSQVRVVKRPHQVMRWLSRFQNLIWAPLHRPTPRILTRKALVHLVTSNCSLPHCPPQKLRANPHVQMLRANPHVQMLKANNHVQVARANPRVQMVRANPRVQMARANPHDQVARANNHVQVAKANPRVQMARANPQTPPGCPLKKLPLNRGSQCSNNGYAH